MAADSGATTAKRSAGAGDRLGVTIAAGFRPNTMPKRRKITLFCSLRSILKAAVGAVFVTLALIGGIYAWYAWPGWPETLVSRRLGRELCVRCGTLQATRYFMILDWSYSASSRVIAPQRPVSNPLEREKCEHLFQTTWGRVVELNLSPFELRRTRYGLDDDQAFWETPALVQCLAELSASYGPVAGVLLVNYLNGLRTGMGIPDEIEKALGGTNVAGLKETLIRSYESTGRDPLRRRSK